MPELNKSARWESIFADWKNSGLTRTEYCQQKNLKVSTFAYWRGRLKKEKEKRKDENSASPLVKLPTPFSACQEEYILELPRGCRLRIPCNGSPAQFQQIIKALKECFS